MENLGLLLGILSVMMCPMVFGGITMYYSHKTIHEETLKMWKRTMPFYQYELFD